jgi:protease PrsW
MAIPGPVPDPRAALEGRPPGRRRPGCLPAVIGIGCALVVLGADLLQSVNSARHSAVPFLVAVPLALLPVPLLVGVILLVDRLEPEPRGDLITAFAWGAGIAALVAAVINTAGLLFITQPDLGKGTGQYVSATFGAPVVEESLKAMVLAWLLWRRRLELDGPTDGIMYAAMVGLGFAMIENVNYYTSALIRPRLGGVELLGVTFVFRGLLSPLAHPIFTSMTGIGAAYAATRRNATWAFWLGLLGAMILHGMWNGLTRFGLGGIVIAYGALACVLCVLIAVIVWDRRRIVRLIQRFLPAYHADGVTAGDIAMLSSLTARRQARRRCRKTGGPDAVRAMTDFQLAATELALCHQRQQRRAIGGEDFERRRQGLVTVMVAAHERAQQRHGGPWPPPGRV